MQDIDKSLQSGNYVESVKISFDKGYNKLGYFLARTFNIDMDASKHTTTLFKYITVRLLCNWCSSKELCERWNKQSQNGRYEWNNVRITWLKDPKPDYTVVINRPPIDEEDGLDLSKTIIFHMEPDFNNRKDLWGWWADPPKDSFALLCDHKTGYNNIEWHLSKSYNELLSGSVPEKTYDTEISAVLSDKYHDEGHMLRIDFAKFLDSLDDIELHVYGGNRFRFRNYKGILPHGSKDAGLMPYKYTFNCENQFHRNYFTEKLIDGILSECLVFYCGCINVREYIDPRAYVQIDLKDRDKALDTIKRAISEKWWEQRLVYIRKAKHKILTELQFFPRLCNIINDLQKSST